jgi:hypothetical protein
MADRYWVGGAGSWTTSSTTNWSTSSGGSSGASVPTASDSVFFDQAGTYTVTVTGALACLDFTVSLGVVSFTDSGSPTITISGSMLLASGTVGTWASGFVPTFNATTSKTITTNGESIGNVTFNGVGGTWTLGSAFAGSGRIITLTNGTFSTSSSNYSVTYGSFSSSNSNTRTLNLNASTFTNGGAWTCTTSTNLTVSGSGATVTITGSSAKTFAGGGANYGAFTLNQGGAGRLTISGSNTFANISNSYNATGATSIRFTSGTTQTVSNFTAEGTSGKVLTIDSTTPATAATLSKASGTVSVSYVSLQDSTATGGATWNANSNSSTNVSGNTGWVFTPFARYWVGGAGTWDTSDTTHWSASSGGAGGASVPTAGEDVIFDQATTYTVTLAGNVFCNDFTISAGLVSFSVPSGFTDITVSGSMLVASGTVGTWSQFSGAIFTATTSKTISTNNINICGIDLDGVGGTWTLGSAFTSTSVNGGINLVNGTFSTSSSNYAVTIREFTSSNSNTRTLNLNASTFTITSTSWTCTTSTNLTVSGSGATVTMTSGSAKTFAGGGANWGAITLDQGGAGRLTISGSNTFANISNSYNATAATSIRFTSGTTQTVTSFTAEGLSGKHLTIDSTTPGTAATLSKASGTVSVDFIIIQDSTATGGATWNAGSYSTNVSGNTGWVFASPISSNFFLVM